MTASQLLLKRGRRSMEMGALPMNGRKLLVNMATLSGRGSVASAGRSKRG